MHFNGSTDDFICAFVFQSFPHYPFLNANRGISLDIYF